MHARVRRVPVWLGVVALVAASIVARYLLARRDPSPWIFIDEIIYSELGRSFASDFDFSIRGFSSNAYGFIYPAIIAPSYALFDSLPSAYGAVKATNAVVMSLTAVPVYLLARRLMRPGYALAAALLSVAVPAMTYTGVVMTENAFYPAFALALLAMVVALERPTKLNQMVAVAALVATFLVRAQGIALIVAYVVALALFALLEARVADQRFAVFRARLRAFWPTWLLGAGALVLFVILQLSRGQALREPLGAYGSVADGERYSVTAVTRWFLYHVAELDLWTGIIPLAALIVLSGFAFKRPGDRRERAFVAAAVPSLFFLTLLVAAFASQSHENRIEERNLFYVGVVPLVALMWWIDRGMPRPPRLTTFALVTAAALPGVIPYGEFINQTAVSDTFGLLPLWGLQERGVAPNHIQAIVVIAALAVALVVLLVPRRLALIAPALVLAYFVLAHSPIERRTSQTSSASLVEGVQTQLDWIDKAVGREAVVAALWTSTLGPQTIWLNEFFNRSVKPVYYFNSPVPGNLPERPVRVDPSTGQLIDSAGGAVHADYALVDAQTDLVGDVAASDPGRGMQLIEIGGAITVAERITGIFGDRWSGAEAVYSRFACTGGEVDVSLSTDPGIHQAPQTVTAFVGESEQASIVIDPSAPNATLTVPLTSSDGACTVRFAVSPTVVPALVSALADTRELGVRFDALSYRQP
ncbi:MAG: glycosyltransferase family 39 protein [Gaiellaceae bacterium]